MTSNNHDFEEALEVVQALLKIAGDPKVGEHLRRLREAAKRAAKETVERERGSGKEADKGTCPTCGKSYSIKSNGALRRHGKGKCYTDDQLPAEIIPAVFAIAHLGDNIAEVPSNGRTQDDGSSATGMPPLPDIPDTSAKAG